MVIILIWWCKYTLKHQIAPILHIFTATIKMKYNLSNNWHHCEPEIDVNSALICCLIPQHFTRGNSTYDFHLKLWGNEHDLSWIIPWFLPSKDKFCLQWPETHPLWPGRSIILLSYLAAYRSSWNNHVLFATPLTVCNSDNALEQVMEFTLKLSQPLCPSGSIALFSYLAAYRLLWNNQFSVHSTTDCFLFL